MESVNHVNKKSGSKEPSFSGHVLLSEIKWALPILFNILVKRKTIGF